MKSIYITRRNFLGQCLAGGAVVATGATGYLQHGEARADFQASALSASRDAEEAVESLFGNVEAIPSESIRLEAPLVTAHKEAVPISVWADLDNIQRIVIVAESNDIPLCTSVTTTGAVVFYSTHIRLSRSSRVTAYVQTDQAVYSRTIRIKTIGAGWTF